ncbi:lipopolysaccharide biosynthesis protein [Marinifilum sp. RC60d5]|uniref:lipopolysaccharide biosynthesis protein n=1 Tax=Marinifilum sp. RC60d5 TaxID=3458414 RepID=UPI004034F7C8
MASLRKESLKGLFWMSLGKVGTGLTSLLVTMVLARILIPEDFALIELLIIFIAVSNVFIDSGFSQAIIRDDNPSQTDLSSVFYLNLGVSIVIYIGLFFTAPLIADFFHAPQLVTLSRVTFLVIIFNSLIIIQNAKLVREFKFPIVSKCAVIGMIGAGVTALILALLGFGVWALAANMIIQPLFKAIALWYFAKWKPSLVFSFQPIKKYFSFGGFLLMQGLLDAIVTNISSMFIGKMYTKKDLGYYSQGRKLDGYIVSPFVSVLEQVTYPITSKLKNDQDKLRESYIEIFQIVIFIFLPTSLFVIFHGDLVVTCLFGDKWIAAGIYLSISSVFDIFFPLQKLATNIIMVKGKTKIMFYLAIVKQVVRLITVVVLAQVSVLALAVGFTVSGIFGGSLYIGFAFKLIKYNIVDFIIDQSKTIIISFASIFIVVWIGTSLEFNKYILLVICGLLMIFCYLSLSIVFKSKGIKSVKKIILSIMKK